MCNKEQLYALIEAEAWILIYIPFCKICQLQRANDYPCHVTLVQGHTIQVVGNLFLLAFSSTACTGGQ